MYCGVNSAYAAEEGAKLTPLIAVLGACIGLWFNAA